MTPAIAKVISLAPLVPEWPELHGAIRPARKAHQQTGAMPDFAAAAPRARSESGWAICERNRPAPSAD